MVTSGRLQRELDSLRREIDELRELELELEAGLAEIRGPLRWLREPGARLLRRDVRARIRSLRLRYNVVYNCCLTAERDERRRLAEKKRPPEAQPTGNPYRKM